MSVLDTVKTDWKQFFNVFQPISAIFQPVLFVGAPEMSNICRQVESLLGPRHGQLFSTSPQLFFGKKGRPSG
jgi:hypothetical protein